RHKGTVRAALVLLVFAVAGLSLSTALIWREQRQGALQKNRAEENAQLAWQAMDSLYTNVAAKWLNDEPGLSENERQFVEYLLRLYQEFGRLNGTNQAVLGETLKAYTRVGRVQRKLGNHKEAEQAFQQALALGQQLVFAFPAISEYRTTLAACCGDLAAMLKDLGRRPEAEKALRQAIDLCWQSVHEFPEDLTFQHYLAKSQGDLGTLLKENGRFGEAETAFRE